MSFIIKKSTNGVSNKNKRHFNLLVNKRQRQHKQLVSVVSEEKPVEVKKEVVKKEKAKEVSKEVSLPKEPQPVEQSKENNTKEKNKKDGQSNEIG